MNPLERKQEKIREAETRRKTRSELASLIAGEVLQGLQEKIASGKRPSNKDIAAILRPIVDEKINIDDKLFKRMAFSDLEDLYNEVTPLIMRGIHDSQAIIRE